MLQPVVPRDGDEQLPRLLLLDLNVSEERQVLQEDTVGLFTTNVVNGPNAFCRDDEDHWQPVQRIGRRRLVGCMQDITITIDSIKKVPSLLRSCLLTRLENVTLVHTPSKVTTWASTKLDVLQKKSALRMIRHMLTTMRITQLRQGFLHMLF